jgi:alcohol dehydrogenase (cytochrome c)
MTGRSFYLVIAASLLTATALTPLRAADMSFERALAAEKEPQNWLLHHGNYQGHRFSQLSEINADTVTNLRLAFAVALGGIEGAGRYKFGNLEATPIVEDGVIYVPDGWGSVYAIDVSSGKKGMFRWKFDPAIDKAWAGDVACCGVNNRGVALWKDKVISISLDGRLFALNKATGEKVWERRIADPALGETLTMAPLVVRDLAIVGPAGGEFGIRGFVDATDLNTGKQAWRTYNIPGAGEPGNETWKDGKNRWEHGGGSTWETATYDPQTDTLYQGIGNAGPDLATTNGRRACSLSTPPTVGSNGVSSTPRTTLTTLMKSPSTRSSTPRSTARIASSSCTPRAMDSFMCSTASTAPSWPASNTSTS